MNSQFKYNVDIVFCIDATGSMKPVINTVKNNILHFYDDVINGMQKKNKHINKLRVRVIAFRDYLADGEEAMLVTDFYNLPEQTASLAESVNSIFAKGGGDEPEDGLEALAYAIHSDWDNEATDGRGSVIKHRKIIVVYTDASTHILGYGQKAANYPKNMPKTVQELSSWWGDVQNDSRYVDAYSKRLIMFAPDQPFWSYISSAWDNVIHCPSVAGQGVEEYTYEEILTAISNSI